MIINPRIRAVELQRGFKLLLGFGVIAFLKLLDAAPRDRRNPQIVGDAQELVIRVDNDFKRFAVRFDIEIRARVFNQNGLHFQFAFAFGSEAALRPAGAGCRSFA